jgi:hypothetical protein
MKRLASLISLAIVIGMMIAVLLTEDPGIGW